MQNAKIKMKNELKILHFIFIIHFAFLIFHFTYGYKYYNSKLQKQRAGFELY